MQPSLLEPFWLSTVMDGESLFFVDHGAGAPAATLLFVPDGAVSLRSATGEFPYEEGRDYVVDSVAGRVELTPLSRIPFTTLGELYPRVDPDGSGFMHRRGDPGTYLMCGDSGLFHQRQTLATYTHQADMWRGRRPGAADLPRTQRLLRRADPVTMCLTGDSISEGYTASAFIGLPPYQLPYGPLVAHALEQMFRSPIAFHNHATAGWTSDDGLADVARVAATHPDLVIVAYGMNDAGYADAGAFTANITAMMQAIRDTAPNAEFILVSPMLPNPEWHYTVMERFEAYRDALAGLCGAATGGAGVGLADMTSLWADLLVRKSVLDLSGNGINHPNDFGHRLYAQAILALFDL